MKQFTIFNQLTAMPKRLAMVLTVLFTLGVGNMLGETKTEGFEKATSGTNYQGTVNLQTSDSDCGISWQIYYGCVSTSSKISGNNSAALRLYTSSNYGYLKTTMPIDGLSKVTFNAKASTSNSAKIKVNISYSKDGKAWEIIASDEEYGTSSASVSYDIPSGGKYFQIAISSNSTKPSKSNAQLTIDDIVFTYTIAPSCTEPTVSWATEPANGNVGGTMTAKANTNYPAGLTYSSSDPSVATIDASGVIEYLKVGNTTITASVRGDGTTYCNETVSVSKTITVTCGNKVTINTTSDGHGTIKANPTSIETCSDNDENRQITITLNPNSHYSSNAPTISGITNATITGSGNTYTIQLPKGSNGTLSVSATFKEDDKYTVIWSADGYSIKTEEIYVNEQVSIVPTISDIPEENRCGDKFVGWTTEAIPTPQDDAPDYFTTVADSPEITKDTTFYAVFADYAN